MRRNPWLAATVLCIALLLHLALWRLLAAPVPRKALPPAPVRVTVLRMTPPVTAATEPARAAAPPARDRRARGASRGAAQAEPDLAVSPRAASDDSGTPTASLADTAASAPGSSASALPSLLDPAATRRAIREAARQPSAAGLGDAPPRADRRLGDAIAGSAKGDCLKGEFAGGGMGLLSLPFWAVAQLRDQCSK